MLASKYKKAIEECCLWEGTESSLASEGIDRLTRFIGNARQSNSTTDEIGLLAKFIDNSHFGGSH